MNVDDLISQAANYGPDAQLLVKDIAALYQAEKAKADRLVEFITFYASEGQDSFGFLIDARRLFKEMGLPRIT